LVVFADSPGFSALFYPILFREWGPVFAALTVDDLGKSVVRRCSLSHRVLEHLEE
jgi:hypothetical protein